MKKNLLEVWYDLCRDAARQKILVIVLAIICSLFYLVSAVAMRPEAKQPIALGASASAVPVGFRAVALQSAGPLPEIRTGDHVDVIIDSTIALERVLVFDVIDQPNRQTTVVLAVPVTSTAMIANAAALGAVSLVLVG
ncbi:MAG: hypothetical protein ACKOH9_03880 [Actinomycetota bacterium]|jgi:hypothetical protein|nr:hypothetical protein [Actinomycetota bacterium]